MRAKSDLRREIATPTGTTGPRVSWPWRHHASLTPARVADILRRASYGDMRDFLVAAAEIEEKDLHYRSVLQTRKLAVAGLPWRILPADDRREPRRAAQLVERALGRIGLHGLIVDLLDALAKGYSVAEIIWDTDGAEWLPREIIWRPPEWFLPDRDKPGTLRLSDGTREGAELPQHKFVVHVPRIFGGLPLHGGLARSALWAWAFKSYALKDWASYAEMYGHPIRLGRYDASATAQDIDALRAAVIDAGTDLAAILPREMAIEIIEAGGSNASADLYQRLIEYMDSQVSKAVLGQTMTSDDGSSLAQAKVHNEVRHDLLRADAKSIAETINRDIIRPIIELNIGDLDMLPRIEIMVDEPEDMAALADQLQRLVPLGMPVPVSWVRAKWGIPEAQDGEDLLGSPAAAAPDAEAQSVSTHAARDPEPTVGDLIAERMVVETESAWVDIMRRIREIVDSAEDLPALREALLNAFDRLPTEQLADVMAMGFAAADLAGRFDVEAESDANGDK